MKKNFKRLFATILTLIMILTIVPLSVMSHAADSATFTLYVKEETDKAVTLAVKLTDGAFNNLDFKITAKGDTIAKSTSAIEADDFFDFMKDINSKGAACNSAANVKAGGNEKAVAFSCASTSAFNKANLNILECEFEKAKAAKVVKGDFELAISVCGLLNDKSEREAVEYKVLYDLPEKIVTFTVKLDAGEGTVSPATATVESGKAVKLPTPKKDGYNCLGWAEDSKATTAKYKCGDEFKPTANVTLYAVWSKIDVVKPDPNKNGLIKEDGKWMLYKSGEIDTEFEGMAKNQYGWWYVKGGTIDFTYSGMAKNDYGWWYMKNGKLDLTFTGMAKGADGWMYATKGKLDTTFTGMAKNQYGWFYMTKGRLDETYTGMAKNQYGWFYMTNGKLDNTYTGMAKNQYGWFYMNKGKLDYTYTGMANGADGWMYAKKGKFDPTFTGMAKGADGWMYATKGKLDETYTGMAKNQYGWFYITKGKLDTTFEGMAKNKYGWFYMYEGKVAYGFMGIADNEYGFWLIVDGKLDTTYTGPVVLEDGSVWMVTKGKAVEDPDALETVYITKKGSKFHYDPNCNGGTYYKTTLDDAIEDGYEPCEKCVLGDY